MSYGDGKSDRPIRPEKPSNKDGSRGRCDYGDAYTGTKAETPETAKGSPTVISDRVLPPDAKTSWRRFEMRAYLGILILAALAVVGRLLAPGSFVQTWVLAPLFVLVMPGLALTPVLLPSSSGWWERLFWAPKYKP